jgi:hypothetical protein
MISSTSTEYVETIHKEYGADTTLANGNEGIADDQAAVATPALWDVQEEHTKNWVLEMDERDPSNIDDEFDGESGPTRKQGGSPNSKSFKNIHRLRHMIYNFPSISPLIQQHPEICQNMVSLLRSHLAKGNISFTSLEVSTALQRQHLLLACAAGCVQVPHSHARLSLAKFMMGDMCIWATLPGMQPTPL